MTLKRTAIFIDEQDHRALFELALDESRKSGRRVTMAEVIRRILREYLVKSGKPPKPEKKK